MKRYIFIILSVIAASLSACEDHKDIIFDEYYVCIKDEAGTSSGTVSKESDDFITSYYVQMVAPPASHDINVHYELVAGDGLREGVDFRVQASTKSPLLFAPGVTRMPVRIIWLRNALDPARDNTLTIRLTSCSENYTIGYPGPQHKFSAYTVTKQ